MRIRDWSSDVCSSDLLRAEDERGGEVDGLFRDHRDDQIAVDRLHDEIDQDRVETGIHSRRKADEDEQNARDERDDIGDEGEERSEERRVGQECVSKRRYRRSAYQYKKKIQ